MNTVQGQNHLKKKKKCIPLPNRPAIMARFYTASVPRYHQQRNLRIDFVKNLNHTCVLRFPAIVTDIKEGPVLRPN